MTKMMLKRYIVFLLCSCLIGHTRPLKASVTKQSKEELVQGLGQSNKFPLQTGLFLFKINVIYRMGSNGTVEPLNEGSVLQSGDRYKIIFTPSVDCFVYIFQVDGAGKIFQLFPMKSFGGVTLDNFNPVKKEQTYYLPAEGKSFQLDEQIGTEKIYFLASRERDLELEELYRKAFEAQQRPQGDLETQLSEIDRLLEQAVNIQGALSPAGDTEEISWEEGGERFSVLQERLENMCDGCVYMLSFEHR